MAGAPLTPLESALAYVAHGYPVFPVYPIAEPAPAEIVAQFKAGQISKKEAQKHARCACGSHPCRAASPGKHPILRDGVNGASTDPEQIRKWWTEAPDANVGVRMPPGRFAVDFDTYEPGVTERLAAARAAWPATLEQTSGAGGVHLVFACDPATKFGSMLDGQSGVDLIHNEHRYLVAEPSNHWTGGAYEWSNDLEPTPAPATVLARCSRGVRQPSALHKPVASLASRDPGRYAHIKSAGEHSEWQCPPGTSAEDWAVHVAKTFPPAFASGEPGGSEAGHVTLKRIAGHLVAGLGLSEEEAFWVLWEHYNPRCVPPWEEDATGGDGHEDFERTIRGAGSGLTPGYLLKIAGDAAEASAKEAKQPPEDPLGRRIDLASEPEPLAYLFEGFPFAPGGKVNAVAGKPNAGKSPFAQLLMFSHCTGEVVAGITPLRKGWGLYQDAETGLLAHHRWRRICRAYNKDPAEITSVDFRDVEAMFSETYARALEQYCIDHGPNGLVVIDTYGAMLTADIDNNSPQFAHWLRQLGVLSRRREVVILVLIHGNKSSKDGELEGIAGNIQGAGAMQGVVTLERTGKGNEAPIQVWCTRAPEHDFAPFQIKWEDVHSSPGRDMKAGGPGLRAVRVEGAPQDEVPAKEVFREKVRARMAKGILTALALTPMQNRTSLIGQVQGDDKALRTLLKDLVAAGIVLAHKTAERVNGHGVAEPILVYEAAPLTPAVVEARLKAGLVD